MPSATALEFQRVAVALGFVGRRQTGSHERWTRGDGQSVTIPLHGGREIGPPLFFKILRQLGVSQEEFDRLRRLLTKNSVRHLGKACYGSSIIWTRDCPKKCDPSQGQMV